MDRKTIACCHARGADQECTVNADQIDADLLSFIRA